jgi:hypothetical protein
MPTDDRAPDGFVVAGYRRVGRNGTVRFDKQVWAHPEFVPGEYVRCAFNWPEVIAYVGMTGTNPDNIRDASRHTTFYDFRNKVTPESVPTPPTDSPVDDAPGIGGGL